MDVVYLMREFLRVTRPMQQAGDAWANHFHERARARPEDGPGGIVGFAGRKCDRFAGDGGRHERNGAAEQCPALVASGLAQATDLRDTSRRLHRLARQRSLAGEHQFRRGTPQAPGEQPPCLQQHARPFGFHQGTQEQEMTACRELRRHRLLRFPGVRHDEDLPGIDAEPDELVPGSLRGYDPGPDAGEPAECVSGAEVEGESGGMDV